MFLSFSFEFTFLKFLLNLKVYLFYEFKLEKKRKHELTYNHQQQQLEELIRNYTFFFLLICHNNFKIKLRIKKNPQASNKSLYYLNLAKRERKKKNQNWPIFPYFSSQFQTNVSMFVVLSYDCFLFFNSIVSL